MLAVHKLIKFCQMHKLSNHS